MGALGCFVGMFQNASKSGGGARSYMFMLEVRTRASTRPMRLYIGIADGMRRAWV